MAALESAASCIGCSGPVIVVTWLYILFQDKQVIKTTIFLYLLRGECDLLDWKLDQELVLGSNPSAATGLLYGPEHVT